MTAKAYYSVISFCPNHNGQILFLLLKRVNYVFMVWF